jgi:hypothetical protein
MGLSKQLKMFEIQMSVHCRARYKKKSFRVTYGTEQKNSISPFLPCVSNRATKRLTALTPEIDSDQTTTGLLIAKSFW